MVSTIIALKNKTGLHSRPAANFVKKANEDGKSIISLLTLGAAYGARIELIIEGEDEEKAMNEMKEFFEKLTD